ncbi:MAG TPA: hypothetical protein VLA77_02430 [Candidatus Saccharimonadales bacterium]|nr:hypothetical protein [Candidatus Saccharimonadales bacterium]
MQTKPDERFVRLLRFRQIREDLFLLARTRHSRMRHRRNLRLTTVHLTFRLTLGSLLGDVAAAATLFSASTISRVSRSISVLSMSSGTAPA